MRAFNHHLLARTVFSLFVALFFLTPVCTVFVPFCTVTWLVGVVALAATVFFVSGSWRPAEAAGAERALPEIRR